MTGDGGFLVDEFLDAVTSQLDRTQDALAAKGRVRPLVFALRNFRIQLQVFVSMGDDGNLRLRSAAPGETGSSTLDLEFTTITRAMIEENTISLAMAQAPSLQEVGLKREDAQQLERLGIRTVAQLQELRASGAGLDGIARLTSGAVPADRLRAALHAGRPQVFQVVPEPLVQVPQPAAAPPAAGPPAPPAPEPAVLHIPPGTRRLQLAGRNLLGTGTPPLVRLGGTPLVPAASEDDRLVVELPHGHVGGALEVELGDGERLHYDVRIQHHPENGSADGEEMWMPEVAR
jgi:hypothetical protein